MQRYVSVFFYGGLINPKMLEKLGVSARTQAVAVLLHYHLTISPWVNVEPSEGGQVYGVVMEMTHAELDKIYSQLKVKYVPVAVAVTQGDKTVPALSYMADEPMTPAQAEEGHVRMLLEAAQQRAFPAWYLERIRSYLPPRSQ